MAPITSELSVLIPASDLFTSLEADPGFFAKLSVLHQLGHPIQV
jgi:hypothetical protein